MLASTRGLEIAEHMASIELLSSVCQVPVFEDLKSSALAFLEIEKEGNMKLENTTCWGWGGDVGQRITCILFLVLILQPHTPARMPRLRQP